jgi:hypothetical protein
MYLKKKMVAGMLIGFCVLASGVAIAGEKETEILVIEESNPPPALQELEEEIEIAYSDYIYTTFCTSIHTEPTASSYIVKVAAVGDKLHRTGVNVEPGWDKVELDGNEYYISNAFVSLEEPIIELVTEIEEWFPEEDLRYLSAIIWAEAGNQCEAGKQAVGIVVMNRVESAIYKDTIYDVINEPYQFSPVQNGSFATGLALYDNGELSEEIINSAKYALSGNKSVEYNNNVIDLNGCLYFSRYVENAKYQIQDHQFK